MTIADRGRGSDLAFRPLRNGELASAAGLLARAMRDTPTSVAVHGADPSRRQQELAPIFDAFIGEMAGSTLCAADGERVVGVAGLAPPGTCASLRAWRIAWTLAGARVSPATAWRFHRWRRAWARADPAQPHWHLGPVAVEPALWGKGIGSGLLDAVCSLADQNRGVLYLESDTQRNVRFYERRGFVVVGRRQVLAQPNWFMRREPRIAEPR